jgi:hypothetical protein
MTRKVLLLGIGLALVGCAKPHRGSPPPARPPTLAVNFVVRPVFVLRDKRTIRAGTAFGATVDGGEPLLLSALHLFGDAGGLEGEIPPARIPDVVAGVALFDMGYGRQVGSAGPALLRDGFPLGTRGDDYTGDLVAFRLAKQSGIGTAPLAAANPDTGARVWLVGREFTRPGAMAALYPAVVSEAADKGLLITMDSRVDLSGFSGAPAINAQGEIVGMTLGGGQQGGKQLAVLNPVAAMRERLGVLQTGGTSPR